MGSWSPHNIIPSEFTMQNTDKQTELIGESFFEGYIGQEHLKKMLYELYLPVYKKTHIFPNILIDGEKGLGKTDFSERVCQAIAKIYHEETGREKRIVKINASALKRLDELETEILSQLGVPNVFFIDEAQNLGPRVEQSFLTMLAPNSNRRNEFKGRVIDFREQTFVFATTDPQILTQPFKDRLKKFTLSNYKQEEIQRIIYMNCKKGGIFLTPSVLAACAMKTRGNGRSAFEMAQDILDFAELKDVFSNFAMDDWNQLAEIKNLKDFGLTTGEIAVLSIIEEEKETTVTHIAAVLGVERGTVRSEMERHLHRNNLIKINEINSQRTLSDKGKDFMKKLRAGN